MLAYNDYVSKILEVAKFLITDQRIQHKVSVTLSFSQDGMSPIVYIRLKAMYGDNAIESEIQFWEVEEDIMYINLDAGFVDPTGEPVIIINSEWFKCVEVDEAKAVIERVIKLYE
ncbi:MAG: hypothetical protein GC179_10370 [Anaerolineaceae bacterium]|nr:hypothetical protein [Anaerolineaceae bacterium]